MASSGYYKQQYKQYKEDAKNYEKYEKELEKIHGNLADDLYDEVKDVNKELDDLKADLKKAVRHNQFFTNKAEDFEDNKECNTSIDAQLSGAEGCISDEIGEVRRKKDNAIRERDRNKELYDDKKDEERAEFLGGIIDAVTGG